MTSGRGMSFQDSLRRRARARGEAANHGPGGQGARAGRLAVSDRHAPLWCSRSQRRRRGAEWLNNSAEKTLLSTKKRLRTESGASHPIVMSGWNPLHVHFTVRPHASDEHGRDEWHARSGSVRPAPPSHLRRHAPAEAPNPRASPRTQPRRRSRSGCPRVLRDSRA